MLLDSICDAVALPVTASATATLEQPETTAVRDPVDRLVNDGKHISLFLDFHSTAKNVFYIQADDLPTTPHDFTQVWFDQAKKSETYPFRPQATSSDQPNAKNYIYNGLVSRRLPMKLAMRQIAR